tara:strand:+ start:243 stop:449 length:207 start_codon:yes stop_codon:yes gene_type:complete
MKELKGANMDIDLTSKKDVEWNQDKCPWNEKESTKKHKCAVKNVSICKHFKGVKAKDIVLCAYSDKEE